MTDDAPLCVECGAAAQLRSGLAEHGRNQFEREPYWYCQCGAQSPCLLGTERPVGRPAAYGTWQDRKAAHNVFDPIWLAKSRRDQICDRQAKRDGLIWLAKQIDLPAPVEIDEMTREQALAAIAVCAPYRRAA